MSGHECINTEDLENWEIIGGDRQTEILLKVNSCVMCKRKWLKHWSEINLRKKLFISK